MDVYKEKLQVYREEETFNVTKSNDTKQTVFGWANVSFDTSDDVVFDWQGDITPIEVLEEAAYDFVLNYRVTGEMHEGDATGTMIESVVFTKEKMAAMGIPSGIVPEGWWIGFYIPDLDVYKKVVDGTYKMFSIQGKAKRIPL